MPVTNTWADRELPILEAVHAGEEAGARLSSERVATETGIDVGVTRRTIEALESAGYLTGQDVTGLASKDKQLIELKLLERGRRGIGQWPPDAADAFLVSLNTLIAAEADPEERTRLTRLRDAAGDVAKSVLAGAIVAAGQAQL